MNKYIKYISIGILALMLGIIVNSTFSILLTIPTALWTIQITEFSDVTAFREKYFISGFFIDNRNLYLLTKTIPHILFLIGLFFFLKKKIKLGFLIIASPLLISIPLLILMGLESQN